MYQQIDPFLGFLTENNILYSVYIIPGFLCTGE